MFKEIDCLIRTVKLTTAGRPDIDTVIYYFSKHVPTGYDQSNNRETPSKVVTKKKYFKFWKIFAH